MRPISSFHHFLIGTALLGASLPVFVSCGGGKPKVTHNTPDPVIESFEADYTLVTAGTEVKLTPKFPEGAGQILVDGKPLEFDGSKTVVSGKPLTVRPTASTTYTLSVSNMAGKPITKDKRIDVIEAPSISAPQVVTTGFPNKASVPERPGCEYEWEITNGIIEQGSTTREVAFKAGGVGTLGLACRITRPGKENLGGKLDLRVIEPPMITKFTAEPSVITVGEPTTLQYEFTGGKGAITDPSLEGLKTGDSHTLWPSLGTTRYELTVTNEAGTSKSQFCSVRVVPPPTLEVTPVGKTVHFDPREGVKLKVNFTNGTCVLRPGDQQLKSGEITLNPFHPMLYEISVTNEAGRAITQRVPVYPAQWIAAGTSHTLARLADGSVKAWGHDNFGQLGNGRELSVETSGVKASTCSVIPGHVLEVGDPAPLLKNIDSVAAGAFHSVALKQGKLWAWGLNGAGQLANGTIGGSLSKAAPIQLKEAYQDTNVLLISCGYNHNLVLGQNALYAGGGNAGGQLGDGSKVDRTELAKVNSGAQFVSVSAGGLHSLALDADGKVWSWGSYVWKPGEGPGLEKLNSSLPAPLKGPDGKDFDHVVAIASGHMYGLALKNDGTVWAWGYNEYGSLGNGSTQNSVVPVQVSGLQDVVAMTTTTWHTFAVKKDGSLWGWGLNNCKQINGDKETLHTNPVQITAIQDLQNLVALALGQNHSVALKKDGTVWTWGHIALGQAGNKFWPSVVTRLSKDAFKDKGRINGQCTVEIKGMNLGHVGLGAPFFKKDGTPVHGLGNPSNMHFANTGPILLNVYNDVKEEYETGTIFFDMPASGGSEATFSNIHFNYGESLDRNKNNLWEEKHYTSIPMSSERPYSVIADSAAKTITLSIPACLPFPYWVCSEPSKPLKLF